jgi:hypothetical protein
MGGIHLLTSYELSWYFSHELHLYWAGQPTFQSHWKNILHQQLDSDIPNSHIMCLSWIMVDRRMEYIYWLLINFPDNLLTSCTWIEQVHLPPSHIGKIYNINTRIVIFLTHILCVSLESWVTDAWNTSIDFLWTFHTFWSQVSLLLSRLTSLTVTLEKYIISTAG